MFAAGLALSGYVHWGLVFATLAAFYMVTLLGLIRAMTVNVFDIAFAGVGLTEIRCGFIFANLVMYYAPPDNFPILGGSITYPNLVAICWTAIQVLTFLVVMVKTLRELALLEPPKRSR